ncbi:MAG: hypothetical protein GF398_13160 [Chitinivibrionales bacterium]|nr:hypothetical protein [Chitinivibrionales bacterium]
MKKMLGVTWDGISTDENAAMWLQTKDFSEEQWEIVQHKLDRLYRDFVTKAAEGRNMSYDSMEALAKGKIYTGTQAHEQGLIDVLGGMSEAIEIARELAGIASGAEISLKRFPRQKGTLSELISGSLSFVHPQSDMLSMLPRQVQPYMHELLRFAHLQDPFLVLMPAASAWGTELYR